MAKYAVYLECGKGGLCMAHVLDLPGCFVRAANRSQALQALPEAIGAVAAWLRQHNEPAPGEAEAVLLEVAEEINDIGPFDPGDAAALFQPERASIDPKEMENAFRLMGHSRHDLLELIDGLPEEALPWQPYEQAFSIQRTLRHIGNAEEWYVSRILPAERLPAEWEHDDEMPLMEFLHMQRATALDCLRRLSAEERSGVYYPTRWTKHPGEAWTARKVLRRFLEHEREHTAQIRELIQQWRTNTLS